MSKAMERMQKARAALIIDQRFFGALALRLNLKEDAEAETMWTDGQTLGFNPEFALQLSMDEVKGIICHEVMHCSAGHHLRRNGRDAAIWNQACDYAINSIIKNSGLTLPKSALISSEFKDQSADSIYTTLNSRKQKEQGEDGGSQGQPGNQQGNGQAGKQNKPQGKSGKADPGGCGEIRDQKADDGKTELTETEKQQHQQEWQVATAQAAQTAKGCGQMKGGLEQIIKEMLEPQVPWIEVLQRFVDQVSHNDYSFKRTNSRYAAFGVIMPSLYDKELPPIDIWVDTSGSISNRDKKQFVAEINDIRSHYKTTIRIVYCDTSVRSIETIEKDDLFESLNTKGGGGTRFSPAIKWSSEQEDQPCCGIYLTDMDCSDFGPEPDFPVLWIDTRGYSYTTTPPFGEVTRINPKRY